MSAPGPKSEKSTGLGARLFYFTGGFLRQKQVRRILQLSGYDLKLGLPSASDLIAVWGRNSRSGRGRAIAGLTGSSIITVEDSFLRSVLTGRSGAAPMGLVVDAKGAYFDCNNPSELEDLLNSADLDNSDLLSRADAGMAALRSLHLSKYNAFDPDHPFDETGYILVIDQTRGDASITHGGANADSFAKMLATARAENPGKTILIKTHPEVTSGYRKGHFDQSDTDEMTKLVTEPLSPWALLTNAASVYCVSSLMGFEAIVARHRPKVFGKPFYAGWGLTDDRQVCDRRQRSLSVQQLFAAAMILYPKWYDPYFDRLCQFEDVVRNLSAQARAWREDHKGYIAHEIRLWKRAHFARFFGAGKPGVRFSKSVDGKGRAIVWAGKETEELRSKCQESGVELLRVEDGFIRSKGLGAELVPPMSLVLDDLGIYYDPTRESRLERHIAASKNLPDNDRLRAEKLVEKLTKKGLGKYNIGNPPETSSWPTDKRRILVPGQVEDDASIRLGTGEIDTNLRLLKKTRAENPAGFIIYKPHPDIEAGLRKGAVADTDVLQFANVISSETDAPEIILAVDEVWTMTSLIGFEALLRSRSVTCLGNPFYAGWGLTQDFGTPPVRRKARPDITALVHATLIDYPRYFDPASGLPCPAEVIVDLLSKDTYMRPGKANRVLSKLQGIFASRANLWR